MVVRGSRRQLALVLAIMAGTAAAWIGVRTLQDEPTTEAPPVAAASPRGIAGYAFQDRNGNDRHDEDEPVLPDWDIELIATGTLPLATERSSDEGVFRFDEIESLPASVDDVTLRVTPVMEGPAAVGLPGETTLAQDFRATLGETIALPVASYSLCPDRDDCPDLELPDLVPDTRARGGSEFPPSTATVIDRTTLPGRTLLRFATSTANRGGLLQVVAAPATPVDERRRVQQRVYGDGQVFVHDAGAFEFHPEHHHFHIGEFVEYELLGTDGARLRSSGKVSFCLTDVLDLGAAPARDGDLRLHLPPYECGVDEQGIDADFADYYGRDLADQWIDMTGLPSGRYWVQIRVNPQNHILESDTSNNTARFPITYDAR